MSAATPGPSSNSPVPEPIVTWMREGRSWANGHTHCPLLDRVTPEFILGVYRIIEAGYTDTRVLVRYAHEALPYLRPLAGGLSFRPLDKSLQLLKRAGLIRYDRSTCTWRPTNP